MLWVYPPKEEEVVEQRKLSDAQKAEIKSIFVLYDANNNGLLEKKELFEALTASGYDDEEIEEMFEEYDQDGSHAIDFDEFCAMLESSYLDSMNESTKNVDARVRKCSHQGPGAARGVTRRVVVDRRPNGAIARETAPVFARGVYIVVIE